MKQRKASLGFTLVEILIAIFIFGILVTIVFASFNTIIGKNEIIDESITMFEMGNNCLNRMIVDLHSIYVPVYSGDSGSESFDDMSDLYRVVGETSLLEGDGFAKLEFTSLGHVPLKKNNRYGIAKIVYYVQAADEGNYVLRRSDNLYPYQPFEPEKSDPVLCEQVKSLAFNYYDRDGTEYESWDSGAEEFKYAIPSAIAIKIEIGNDSVFHVFETKVSIPVCR